MPIQGKRFYVQMRHKLEGRGEEFISGEAKKYANKQTLVSAIPITILFLIVFNIPHSLSLFGIIKISLYVATLVYIWKKLYKEIWFIARYTKKRATILTVQEHSITQKNKQLQNVFVIFNVTYSFQYNGKKLQGKGRLTFKDKAEASKYATIGSEIFIAFLNTKEHKIIPGINDFSRQVDAIVL